MLVLIKCWYGMVYMVFDNLYTKHIMLTNTETFFWGFLNKLPHQKKLKVYVFS